MRRLFCVLTAGLLWAAGAHAASPSLFDPRVTLDVADAPLDEVLQQISAQTGLRFDTPFFELDRRMQQNANEAPPAPQRVPDLAAARERANPRITLQVSAAPVADVMDAISDQADFAFRYDGAVTWRMVGPRRTGQAATSAPQTVAGDYLVSLASLRLSRSHEIVYGERALNHAAERLNLTLRVDAPSELGRYAVAGVASGAEVELDGQLLTSAWPADRPPPVAPLRDAGREGLGYQLEFLLPDVPGEFLDRVTGALSILNDLRELVFEFESLGPQAQRQTDGEIDVTVALGPAAEDGERSRRRAVGPLVEVTVSRPSQGLATALTPNDSRLYRGGMGLEVQRGLPRDVAIEVRNGGVFLGERNLAGRLGAAPALLPKVAFQTADGALHLAEARDVNARSTADRVELTCRMVLDETWEDPRIWVAVLDGSGETTPVPFAIGDVPIPAAEPDRMVVAPPPPPPLMR